MKFQLKICSSSMYAISGLTKKTTNTKQNNREANINK